MPRATPAHPVTIVDVADLPGGGHLHLLQCGDAFSIQFGDDELMGSEVRHSEQALAELACWRLDGRDGTVLIGGLGMGFTLGAALEVLSPDSTVVVAELVPTVITWARGPLAHIFGDHLADRRVSIKVSDVHDVISGTVDHFDVIMLDVDNGPDGFLQPLNDRLYCNWGLQAAYRALRPRGVLAIWSAYADAAFVTRLENAGFSVEEISMPANRDGDGLHFIWLASKPV
ncbi:spermidine synthase [Sphingobium sufflavum]|uniref:spermidine synthase n=1 Tax=Sphingobium sufflavum TaxID=1129547 RepID=UPI001F476A25|nr:spermidine synthase [Sphingobium sufflavum]MCE7796584.1 spermidine synthase [Sphingobium sufflavum]